MSVFDRYEYLPHWAYIIQWNGDNVQECEDFLRELWHPDARAEKRWDSDTLCIFESSEVEIARVTKGDRIVIDAGAPKFKIMKREESDMKIGKKL